jgi:VWFA-related protein
MRRLLALAVCLSLTVTPLVGQQSPIPSLGETIEISIINVDVVVTDKSGKRVRGLTQADFEIYEDGKLQPVTNFAEYAAIGDARITAGGPAKKQQEEVSAPRQRRTMVIFLEEFRLAEFRVKPFFAALKAAVRKTIEPGDALSIVAYKNHKPEVRIESTDDLAVIDDVLDELQKESTGVMVPSAAIAFRQAKERRQFEAVTIEMANKQGVKAVTPDAETLAIMEAKPFAIQARDEMRRRVKAINAVVQRLAGLEGRKVLLLATNRLGAYSGAEFFFAAGLDKVPALEHDEFDNRDDVRTIIDSANDAGVTIYPFYPPGLDVEALGTELTLRDGQEVFSQTSGSTAQNAAGTVSDPKAIDNLIMLNENSMLVEVAEKTGGMMSWGTANIADLLPRIADDLTDYYSLAYRATPKKDGVPRQVVVKTKNRAYEVRARREVVEKSDDMRMNDRVTAAALGDVQPPPFDIAAELAPLKKGVLPLKVRVPIASLTLVPNGSQYTGAFSVYVVSANEKGDVSDVTRQTQTFEIKEDALGRADDAHFTYELDMRVAENTTRVAVGVMDEVSKSYGLASVPVR